MSGTFRVEDLMATSRNFLNPGPWAAPWLTGAISMGIPVRIELWEPHSRARRWVIVWERSKILAYKSHDEAVAAATRLGYHVVNESPCQHTED